MSDDEDQVDFLPDDYKCAYYEENHILRNPVQCGHCSRSFCQECLKKDKCPMCPDDKEKNINSDKLKEEVIKKCFDSWCCEFCEERFGNKSECEHKNNCKKVTYQCSICNYFWTDDESKFWTHLKSIHEEEVIKKLDIGKRI